MWGGCVVVLCGLRWNEERERDLEGGSGRDPTWVCVLRSEEKNK